MSTKSQSKQKGQSPLASHPAMPLSAVGGAIIGDEVGKRAASKVASKATTEYFDKVFTGGPLPDMDKVLRKVRAIRVAAPIAGSVGAVGGFVAGHKILQAKGHNKRAYVNPYLEKIAKRLSDDDLDEAASYAALTGRTKNE